MRERGQQNNDRRREDSPGIRKMTVAAKLFTVNNIFGFYFQLQLSGLLCPELSVM